MTTVARPITADSAHWYYTDGRPCYELPKKDGSGMKVPTLADARKLCLLPSVTTILKVLDKPALNEWKVEQGVLAVITTPRLPGEELDTFIHRVLHVDKVQEQEGQKARDKGTDIHNALETYFSGQEIPLDMRVWIEPAAREIASRGSCVGAEIILVGNGYAGKTDLIQERPEDFLIWDFKSTKKLPPKASWDEHVLQLAAYAEAWQTKYSKALPPGTGPGTATKPIRTLNCYISTVEPGQFIIHENNPDWQKDFDDGFMPIVQHWQWRNDYRPMKYENQEPKEKT